MQKVYRLLRNNNETGPYTLEELLQTNLQLHDLVWVEGKSGSWAYPYEVEELKPYLAPSPQPAGKKASAANWAADNSAASHIFVSLPGRNKKTEEEPPLPATSIEQRAEALRQRVQQQTAAASSVPAEEIQTNYTRSLQQSEEEYTQWLYEKRTKRKKNARKYLATTGLVAGVFTVGLLVGQLLHKSNTAAVSFEEQHAETTSANTASMPPEQITQNENSNVVVPADSVQQQPVSAPASAIKKEVPAKKTDTPKAQPQVQAPLAVTNDSDSQAAPTDSNAAPEKTTVATAPAEEKKKKGGLFSNLFRRRQKEPEQSSGAAAVPENENNTRKARRRGEVASAPVQNLTDQIELKSSVPQNNWMLGITGQKLTLLNHSSETIKTAAVEVSFSSEENGVLEKKTIYFNNVTPKGQATAAVPDHRLAEKVSFRLLSAVAVMPDGKQ